MFFFCSAILVLANSWAARASSQLANSCLSLSSIAGNFVFSNVDGNALGDSPCISLKVFGVGPHVFDYCV